MNVQLALLLAYSVALVAIGLWVGRRVRTSGSFFVAGRGLSPLLLFSTMLAANIGAGSTVGAASLGYRGGLTAWWWNGSAGIGSLVLAFWIGPRLWRAARDGGFLTLGDYLESRYGATVRAVTAVTLWLITLFVLAAQLIGVSSILQVVAGQPRWVGAAVGGVVMLVYFVAGGLLSSAWVNLVQLAVMIVGFLAALPYTFAPAMHVEPGRHAVLYVPNLFWSSTLFPMLAPAFMVSPGLIQKTYGARDERAVRLGVGTSGLALMAFAVVPPLLGMAASTLHPDLASPDLALPTVLMRDVPTAIGSLGLAAVFSAEVSSADAALFMLATSASQDLYRRFLRPQASDGDVLMAARVGAVVGGLGAMLVALQAPTVVQALSTFYSLLTVMLFVPVVAAVLSPRVHGSAALAAMATGVVGTMLWPQIVPSCSFLDLMSIPVGLLTSALIFGLVSFLEQA